MISESHPRFFFRGAALAGLALSLVLTAAPARAEDPLLGLIKVIKCVGCDPGAVNLVVHDPIDVRDFEVQIKEADYQKIVTPLAGKTVYDKEGCFYWMEPPKSPKPPAGKEGAKDPAGDAEKGAEKKTARKGAKADASPADSSRPQEGLLETSSPAQEPQGTPSRCIPYVRIEPKPSHPDGKKGEE
ncbi:MAG TPA: hypothetical protein VJ385_10610 [Fibrobacteria bacterium]|nr:hypothetical protein [Fibrobacteria bacterium]